VAWDPNIPTRERCGALFQSTTLLDSLTIAGNVAVALAAAGKKGDQQAEIKRLIETVWSLLQRENRLRG